MMAVVSDRVDFFVSYTSADRPWAEWIVSELELAGYSTVFQDRDMPPGSNFVLAMDDAAQDGERTVAVLSPASLASGPCRAEWAAALREDFDGTRRKLVPVRVRACDPRGLLGSVVYVDVVGLSEAASRTRLLEGVTGSSLQPESAAMFPGSSGGGAASERVQRPEDGAAIFNVPVMTRTFVGRELALEQLATSLSGDGAVAVTQVDAIHGLGGVGKTQLAAHYARTRRGAYDVIWWLRGEESATLVADLAELAVALGLVDVDVDEADAVAATRDWLERNYRWLLIFDNAPSPDAIAELVPEGEGGHVLITSRAHADWRSLGARPIALNVWERTESRAFLTARIGEHDEGVLDEVADALGDLPLALEQAAAYSNRQAITLTEYLQRLQDRAPELFALGRPHGYEHTVATVWNMAFEQLAAYPIARDVLDVCAHLAPDRIPRELLEACDETTDARDITSGGVDGAIELLLSYSLLTAGPDRTLNMHRLIQKVAVAHGSPHDRRLAATRAVKVLERVFPAEPYQPEQWPSCQRLIPHVLTATGHATRWCASPEATAMVLAGAAQYENERGEFLSARPLTERALAIFEDTYGAEHVAVAFALGMLGNVLAQLGNAAAARGAQERALAIFERVCGPKDPHVARTAGNLGSVLEQLGDLRAARVAQQRALAINEDLYGPDDPRVAHNLSSLGNVLLQLGELHGARSMQESALAIIERAYGPEDRRLGPALVNLGNALELLGDLQGARIAHERALAIFEAVYGLDHLFVGTTLANLGNVLARLGELRAARGIHERALAIKESVYGPRHAEIAITLGNLGNVMLELSDLGAARAAQERALAIEESVFGPENPELGVTLTNLAAVLLRLGDDAAAHALQERARRLSDNAALADNQGIQRGMAKPSRPAGRGSAQGMLDNR